MIQGKAAGRKNCLPAAILTKTTCVGTTGKSLVGIDVRALTRAQSRQARVGALLVLGVVAAAYPNAANHLPVHVDWRAARNRIMSSW